MKATLSVLNELVFEGVIEKYAIGGAMGAIFYVEPFTTFDLDVFVIVPQPADALLYSLSGVYARLKDMGYQEHQECVLIEGVPVQFLPAYNVLLEEALNEANTVDYDGIETAVLSCEYLAAVAVQTGRVKDRMRIHMFLDNDVLDISKIEEILTRHNLTERWKQWIMEL